MSDTKQNITKGELLDYGHAPYKDDPKNTQSYFVQLRYENGVVDKKWGVDLERALEASDVQRGDTIILNDKGKQPVSIPDSDDPSKSKVVNKNLWEVDKYEPILDLPNAIEHDLEREQQKATTADKTEENERDERTPNSPKNPPDFSEFDYELPSSIKNNYVAVVKNRYLLDQKTNYYDKDDKQQVNIAFEDRNKSLHTSRQDEKTVYAMLDMAQSKGWSAIKLKGTEEFKQKVWLEASLRGIETKGYTPNEKDLAELQMKQAERTTNQVEMTAQVTPKPQQETEQVKTETQEQTNQSMDYKEIAKNVAIETATVAATPAPLQPFVAGAFLANDLKDAKEYVVNKLQNTPEAFQNQEYQNKELKQDIIQIFQNGYKDGIIKSRDDLVVALKAQGYNLQEHQNSIRVTTPDGTKSLDLKNEVFTKLVDNVKDLKDRLEPETLKQTYPNLKDSDIVHITAYKNKILEERQETNQPQSLQAQLEQLEKGVKELAQGKELNFPSLPIQEIKPDIEVRTTDNHDKSRQV